MATIKCSQTVSLQGYNWGRTRERLRSFDCWCKNRRLQLFLAHDHVDLIFDAIWFLHLLWSRRPHIPLYKKWVNAKLCQPLVVVWRSARVFSLSIYLIIKNISLYLYQYEQYVQRYRLYFVAWKKTELISWYTWYLSKPFMILASSMIASTSASLWQEMGKT